MENKLKDTIQKFNDAFLDLPISRKVSDLILNPELSFEQHLRQLNKLDKINDANALKLHKSPKDLLQWIDSNNKFEKAFMQLRAYLHIAQKEKHPDTFQKYYTLWVKTCKQVYKTNVDVSKVILQNKAKIKKYLQTPALQPYAHWFKIRYFDEEKHQIDDYEARAIREIHGSYFIDRLYSASMSGDADFQPAKDSNGKIVKYETMGEYLGSEDPAIRQSFWCSYTYFLYTRCNTLSELIGAKFFRTLQMAKFKSFKTIHNMIMHDFELPPIVGERVFRVCRKCKEEFAWFVNYNDIASRIHNGAKAITPWDRIKGPKFTQTVEISRAEAQEDIAKALEILGPEYSQLVQRVFNEKWIDWYYAPKHDVTNFSCASPGNYYYPIKVDFKGNLKDVIALAHEIGHSLNAELSKKNGVYQGYHRVLAEVPSFVNETLMFLYYLNVKYKGNEHQEELALCHYMFSRLYNNICENCILQLTVNELEKEYLEAGELFFPRILTTFRRCQDEYGVLLDVDRRWADSDDILKIYDIWCMPQIFGSIGDDQVMLYLLGATIGVCIALRIYNGDKQLSKKYISFLKAGQTKNPISLLKALGFDITKPETFDPLKGICRQLISVISKYTPADPNARRVEQHSGGLKKIVLKKQPGQSTTKRLILRKK